jgi:hypothetical protein
MNRRVCGGCGNDVSNAKMSSSVRVGDHEIPWCGRVECSRAIDRKLQSQRFAKAASPGEPDFLESLLKT